MAEQNIRTVCRSKLEERSLAVLKAGDVIMVEKDKILAAAAKAKIQLIGFQDQSLQRKKPTNGSRRAGTQGTTR